MGIIKPKEVYWDGLFVPINPDKPRVSHWLGNIVGVVFWVIVKVCWRYQHFNQEALRRFRGVGGVILVSPHKSFLDVVFIYLAARIPQWVRFMARDTLFDAAKGFMGFAFARFGAFPIKRGAADRKALKRASYMLKEGEIVGIFPEGTRRGKGSAAPELHAGAAFVARMGNAPLLPVGVRNVELVKPKGKRVHFPKVTVHFGEAILLRDFDFLPKDDRLLACSWYVMRESFAIDKNVSREEVNMRELFPDVKDYTDVFAHHEIPTYTAEEAYAILKPRKKAEAQTSISGASDSSDSRSQL